MTTFRRSWIVLILAASVITSVVFTNIVERGDTSAWENPYEDWGKPNYALLGGQGNHFHSKSFAISPDAVAQTEEAFQQFDQHIWPESVWAIRGVHVGGFENTNGGYEWIAFCAHNQRRTGDQYRQLMEHAESIAPIYGYKIIRGSEVYPPHEGMMWNGLCRGNLSTYPNAFATWSKMEFVHRVVKAQTIQYHSIAVILHPQCSHTSGRNTLSEAKAMVIAGAEIIEIFNGNWESGDDLVVNDHYRTNSTNMENALADGNAESLWDQILSDGLRVWGGGCDDWHGRKKGLVNPPPPSHMWSGNWVWMEILAPKKAGPEILLRRLEQGSFYTTQGVQIVDICVEGDSITVVGDDSVDFIEVIGSVGGPVALGPLNQGDGDSGTLLLKQYGNMVTYTADPTTPYDDIYVRFRLVNTDYQECYYDEHGDGGGDVYAWTQPFFARK